MWDLSYSLLRERIRHNKDGYDIYVIHKFHIPCLS